jgi:hypothetical protein
MLAITLAIVVLAAPIPKNEAANTAATKAVLAELGLADSFGKLADVPKDYRITADELKKVRENADEFPLRAAILQGGETLAKYRGVKVSNELAATDWNKAKALAKDRQKPAANRIIDLEEALERIEALEKFAQKETHPRWKAHHQLVVALLQAELARTHEYNVLLGMIITEQLPENTFEGGTTGLRLIPHETMKSRKAIRKLATDANERFQAMAKDYRLTPWGEVSEKLADAQYGLRWEVVKGEGK